MLSAALCAVGLAAWAEPDAVRLWKDGPYFATCNVGADKPEDYGFYFWWGDTVGYTNNNAAVDADKKWLSVEDGTTSIKFSESDVIANQSCGKTPAQLQEAGFSDDASTGVLNATHDAATAHLGESWRMPTKEELELLTNTAYCVSVWTNDYNKTGVAGLIVTGVTDGYTDKSIFLPAAGVSFDDGGLGFIGDGTFAALTGVGLGFWSSSPDSSDSSESWDYSRTLLDSSSKLSSDQRFSGYPVRAVKDAPPEPPEPEGVSAESAAFAFDVREEIALAEGETTVSNVTWSATQWGKVPETFTTVGWTNLAANAFTAAGYAFEGWTTNGAGGRIVFADRARIANPQPGAIYDLKAVWTPVPTTVGSYDDLKKVLEQAAKIGKPVEIVLDGTITPPAGEALVLPAVVDVKFSGDGKIGGLVFKEGVDWFADSIAEHSDVFAYVDEALTNVAGLVICNGLPEESRPIDLAALTDAMEKAGYEPAVTPLNALVATGDGTAAMPGKWVDEATGTPYGNIEAPILRSVAAVTPDFGSEEDPVPPKVIAGDVIGEDGNRYTWDVVNETPDVVIEEPLAVIGTIDGLAAFAEEALADVKFTIAPKPVDKTPGSDCDKMIRAITEGNYEPTHVSVATFTPSADGVTVTTPGSQLFAIPLKVKTAGRTNFRVARIHGGVAEAFTEIFDEADRRDGTFIVGDGVVIAFSDKFSPYTVTSSDATQVALPKETKATYAVTNLTTGAEILPSGTTADGRQVYDLPIGLAVSITATRTTPGYVIGGENPLVIDPVTDDAAAMQALIDAGLPAPQPDGYLVYDFTATLKTTTGRKGISRTMYTVNLGHNDNDEYWWQPLGYSDNTTAKIAVTREFNALRTEEAKAAYVLEKFGFDVTASNPQTRWPKAEKYDARGNPWWCHTLRFTLTSTGCYRMMGNVVLRDQVRIYTESGDWSFADGKRWIDVSLLNRFGGTTLAMARQVEMVGGYEENGRPFRMAGQGMWTTMLGRDAKTGRQVGGLQTLSGNIVGVLPGPDCGCCGAGEPALFFGCMGLPVDITTDPSQNATAASGTFSLRFNKTASRLR